MYSAFGKMQWGPLSWLSQNVSPLVKSNYVLRETVNCSWSQSLQSNCKQGANCSQPKARLNEVVFFCIFFTEISKPLEGPPVLIING